MNSRLSVAIGLALGGSFAAAGALAQEEVLEEVVVTGSYLYSGVESPSPVTVLGGEDIRAAAPADLLTFFFDNVPQNFSEDIGAQTGENNQGRQRGGGRNATINLRGIGNENTLNVLNGRRTISAPTIDGGGWPSVNINSLVPRIAIQRVETLLDGGSAIFGSDPVAGVVNFITNSQFRGFDVSFDTRINEEVSDAGNHVLGVMWGGGNERTNVVIAGEFSRTERILLDEISGALVDNPDVSPETGTGLQDLGFANFQGAGMGAGNWLDPDCGNPALGPPILSRFQAYEDTEGVVRLPDAGNPATLCAEPDGISPTNSIQNEQAQNTLFISVDHQFSDTLSGNFELNYATQDFDELEFYGDGNASAWITTPANLGADYQIPTNHPGLIRAIMLDPTFAQGMMGQDPVYQIGETIPFNNTLDSFTESETSRIAFSLDGELSDNWQWHLDLSSASSEVDLALRDIVVDNYQLAINGFGGPNCGVTDVANPGGALPGEGSCFWHNPFISSALPASAGGIPNDPAMLEWLIPNRVDHFESKFHSADFLVTGNVGELAGGPIGIAVGLATRHEEISRDAAEAANSPGVLATVSQFGDWGGEQDIDSLFFEIALPLTDTFNLQVAARNEDYGTVSETTPKIAFNWTPTDDLTLRASYGTSFRGPSIVHSQATQIITTGMTPAMVTFQGMNYGMGMFAFPYTIAHNPDVLPQTADNFSAGFDYDVGERVSVGATFVQIEFEDRITTPAIPNLVFTDACLVREPDGTPTTQGGNLVFLGVAGGGCMLANDPNQVLVPFPDITGVVGQVFNAGNLDAEFIDLRATMNFGDIRFTPSVTITTKYEFDNVLGTVGRDDLCPNGVCDGVGRALGMGFSGVTSMPRWQANFPVVWNINGAHSLRVNLNYRDGLNTAWGDLSDDQRLAFQRDDGQWITNLSYNWRLPNDATTVSFLVNNLSATEPPANNGGRFNRRLREFGIQLRHSFDN